MVIKLYIFTHIPVEIVNCKLEIVSRIKHSIAVWPDLAKFRHFSKMLRVFGQLLKALFTFWQKIEPTLAIILCYWAS